MRSSSLKRSSRGRRQTRKTSQERLVDISQRVQKRSGDPNPQYFSRSIAVQMGGVLPYKWEAYCSTNGRRIAGFPFLRSLEARKVQRYKWGGAAVQIGGVLPYFLDKL